MRQLSTAIVLAFAMSVVLPAAIVDCGQVTLLSQVMAPSTGGDPADYGCYDQDKIYTNFYYSGTQYTPDQLPLQAYFLVINGLDVHFLDLFSPSTSQRFTSPFQFGYIITVNTALPGNGLRRISQVGFDILGSSSGAAATKSIWVDGSAVPVVLNDGSDVLTSAESIRVLVDVTATGFSGVRGVEDVYTQTLIPEPATYALFGGGLLALGLLSRRRLRK